MDNSSEHYLHCADRFAQFLQSIKGYDENANGVLGRVDGELQWLPVAECNADDLEDK